MVEQTKRSVSIGSNLLTITSLLLCFVGPLFFAWWFIESGRAKLINQTNHGTLIDPPVDIRNEKPLNRLMETNLRPGEWAAVYYTEGGCSSSCQSTLKTLSTVRSLLGRDGPRLYVWSLISDVKGGPREFQLVDANVVEKLLILYRERVSPEHFENKTEGIVVMDWRAQLILFYSDFEPAGIKADLSRLLRASRLR